MTEASKDLIGMSLEALKSLGLPAYEAKAYIALLEKHPLNGNEISRLSGVPGPKIYETLNRMVQKGLVSVVSTDPQQLYIPIPYKDFLRSKRAEFEAAEKTLEANLGIVSKGPVDIGVWQLTGYDLLIRKTQELLDAAREDVLVSMWYQQGRELEEKLAAAYERGVKVTSIQFGPEFIEIGQVFRHCAVELAWERHANELMLVIDGSVGLFVGRPQNSDWYGFWTTNSAVVRLVSNYIRHDIYANRLIDKFEDAVKSEYGDGLEGLLRLDSDRGPGALINASANDEESDVREEGKKGIR